MTSYANNFSYYQSDVVPETGKLQGFIITPYANVPCDMIPWYMSPGEFASLPVTAQLMKVKSVCTPYGYRLPFLVKGSGLTYANSQADIIGCYGYGLNNKFNGLNVRYTYDANNPMNVTGIAKGGPSFVGRSVW